MELRPRVCVSVSKQLKDVYVSERTGCVYAAGNQLLAKFGFGEAMKVGNERREVPLDQDVWRFAVSEELGVLFIGFWVAAQALPVQVHRLSDLSLETKFGSFGIVNKLAVRGDIVLVGCQAEISLYRYVQGLPPVLEHYYSFPVTPNLRDVAISFKHPGLYVVSTNQKVEFFPSVFHPKATQATPPEIQPVLAQTLQLFNNFNPQPLNASTSQISGCTDRKTKLKAWQAFVSNGIQLISCTLSLTEDRLYTGTSSGSLFCYDSHKGSLLFQVSICRGSWIYDLLEQRGRLYCASNSGSIITFDCASLEFRSNSFHSRNPTGLACHSTKNILVSVAMDFTLRVFNLCDPKRFILKGTSAEGKLLSGICLQKNRRIIRAKRLAIK